MTTKYLIFPQFNPIIISIGPISLHWYGLMYVIGFMFAMWPKIYHMHKYQKNLNKTEIEYLISYSMVGIFFGGRIGYVLFYNLSLFLDNPLYIFQIWHGGMSFHGGLIGVIISIMLVARRTHRNFFQIADCIVPIVPFGLGAGRLGNFINGELWGRVTTNVPWAMLFSGSRDEDIKFLSSNPQWQFLFDQYGSLPRHPSQLYEMILEGIILFILLHIFVKKTHPIGSASGLFLICYSTFRIFVEFFRQPDTQLGFFVNIFSMGQLLSLPMLLFGIMIMISAYYRL